MVVRIGTRDYNTDTAIKICETPDGILYRKQNRSREFFLYNPKGPGSNADKISHVEWAEANRLVKTYGTREQWMELFTLYRKETGVKHEDKRVMLDRYHFLKAERNADRLNLSIKDYIVRLIDKDDATRNYQ